jgi:molybdopterin-guanine dinucleotide biosynthesis protein B
MIGFVGRSGSGKTTLLTKIIPEFRKRNIRVGTIKHTHHEVMFDSIGKDSWKHRQAGAGKVMLLSDREMAFFSAQENPVDIDMMRDKWFSDCDLLIIEGFKKSSVLKIEVYRTENKKTPLYPDPDFSIDAVITDAEPPFPVPHFAFTEIDKIIDWVCGKLNLDNGMD